MTVKIRTIHNMLTITNVKEIVHRSDNMIIFVPCNEVSTIMVDGDPILRSEYPSINPKIIKSIEILL